MVRDQRQHHPSGLSYTGRSGSARTV